MSNYKLPMDYIDVAARIVEFRKKYPEGSLQQVTLDFREVAGGWWVIYTAAAYRTADDSRPGHGTAWEPVPGRTNFTRDSEVQNAETAAWGRAIVAALAADTKKGVASAEEVRNRQAPQDQGVMPDEVPFDRAPFEQSITAAATANELAKIGEGLAKAHMPEDDRRSLRRLYAERITELQPARTS